METNDTDLTSTSQTIFDVYGSFTDLSNVIGEDGNRGMLFYRLSSSDFDGLETAWTDVPLQDTNQNTQDGRCYYNYITGVSYANRADGYGTGKEYLNYPSCARDGTSDDWYCQMYLPARDQQSNGSARFDEPGVLTGYFIASYIPTLEQVSFQKTK